MEVNVKTRVFVLAVLTTCAIGCTVATTTTTTTPTAAPLWPKSFFGLNFKRSTDFRSPSVSGEMTATTITPTTSTTTIATSTTPKTTTANTTPKLPTTSSTITRTEQKKTTTTTTTTTPKTTTTTPTTTTEPSETTTTASPTPRYFGIDGNHFVKDGRRFRYISGSFHYFRSMKEKWADILHKFKLAGLNTVQTYIEWSSHQPTPAGQFNFSGNLNLFEFLNEAARQDLLVILRPGPYIDSERDMGGLPPWLLWQTQNIRLRTSDLEYNYFVSRWFDYLLPRLVPYLYENGGPVIMVQIENEYGSFGCDKNYTIFLRDLMRKHLGSNVTLFTTDGNGESYLKCGSVPDVFATVDFGPNADVEQAFTLQRKFNNQQGPFVNSEYYTGWLDHWQQPHSTSSSDYMGYTLSALLQPQYGANVNFYMFYGGTSFGYSAGANIDQGIFQACPTSYDYDAPLNEAGDPTDKYWEIRAIVSEYVRVPEEVPVISPKGNYGTVQLRPFSYLHSHLLSILDSAPVYSLTPLSFEDLKIGSGFVLYETTIDFLTSDPVLFSAPGLKDRAYVIVDDVRVGILSRTEKITSLPISIKKDTKLTILVENQGRPAFGSEIGESKGLGSVVTLGQKSLKRWKHYRLGELNAKVLEKYSRTEGINNKKLKKIKGSATFYIGNVTLSQEYMGSPLDTFVKFDGWTRGLLWVNGFNLGRYWPIVGPQETLYLPGSLLNPPPASNTFLLFELENPPDDCIPTANNEELDFDNGCHIELTDTHIINGKTPYTDSHFE